MRRAASESHFRFRSLKKNLPKTGFARTARSTLYFVWVWGGRGKWISHLHVHTTDRRNKGFLPRQALSRVTVWGADEVPAAAGHPTPAPPRPFSHLSREGSGHEGSVGWDRMAHSVTPYTDLVAGGGLRLNYSPRVCAPRGGGFIRLPGDLKVGDSGPG